MKCRQPYRAGLEQFGCGQCLPCRINRRRIWTHRLVLEARMHLQSCFVTLTYARLDCNSPYGPILPTLRPLDVQLFLKRYRLKVELPIRFFAVGEYGERTWRPHYHLALFGVAPGADHGMRFERAFNGVRQCRCSFCLDLRSAWSFGAVDVGTLTWESAQYMTGYMCKAMTTSHLAELKGRYPEFTRMSLRPGLGALAVPSLAASLAPGLPYVSDVPAQLRHSGKLLPLGGYLRDKLREAAGVTVEDVHRAREARASEAVQSVLDAGGPALARAQEDGQRAARISRSELMFRLYGRKEGSL